MNWLVKTNAHQFEIWSETEYQNRLSKCQYYGARPFWKNVRRLTPPDPKEEIQYRIGEVIPYRRSTLEERFAVIIKLFTEAGRRKFMALDIENRKQVISPVN